MREISLINLVSGRGARWTYWRTTALAFRTGLSVLGLLILLLSGAGAARADDFGFQATGGGSHHDLKSGRWYYEQGTRVKGWICSYAEPDAITNPPPTPYLINPLSLGNAQYSSLRVFDWESFKTIAPSNDLCFWDLAATVDAKGIISRIDYVLPVGGSATQYDCQVVVGVVEGRGVENIDSRPHWETVIWEAASDPTQDFYETVAQALITAAISGGVGAIVPAPYAPIGDVVGAVIDGTSTVVSGLNADAVCNMNNLGVRLYNLPLKGNTEYTIYICMRGATKAVAGGIAAGVCEIDFYDWPPHIGYSGPDPLKGRGIRLSGFNVLPPPHLVNADPADGTVAVPVDKTISLTFSKAIRPGVDYNMISLKDNLGNTWPLLKNCDGNKLVIRPAPHGTPLAAGREYTLTVPSLALKDTEGSSLASSYRLTFSTPRLTVTAPNGGEFFQTGTQQAIRWKYDTGSLLGTTVRIELLKNGQPHSTLAAGHPVGGAGLGEFTWTVPPNMDGTGYQIRVTSNRDGNYTDTSDGRFSIGAAGSNSVLAAGWDGETVESAGDTGQHASLVLDASGRPRVSYYDKTNGDLKYAYRDGTAWRVETVDAQGDVGKYTSIALDRTSGYPRISYFDETNGHLKYAYRDATGWHIETVDSADCAGKYTSLALDTSGRPRISYVAYHSEPGTPFVNGDLRYAWKDASGWHTSTLDSAGDVDSQTSLRLDSGGAAHIAYYERTGGDLKYYRRNPSGTGVLYTVDTAGNVGNYASLALDAAGQPHITYCANYGLRYAHRDGGGWHVETVDGGGAAGLYTSLVLDGTGNPHIAYFENSGNDLKYAYKDVLGWHPGVVDSGLFTGQFASLALDASGRPHVAYYDKAMGDLRYACRTATPQSLAVDAPNGGEQWHAGSTQTVRWHFSGGRGTPVNIELLKGGAFVGTITSGAATGADGTGSYPWPIPETLEPWFYQVRITSTTDASCQDASNGAFTVLPPLPPAPTITVVSPNGGETWTTGVPQTITWRYTGNPGAEVDIELLKDGQRWSGIGYYIPIGSNGTGSFTWTPDEIAGVAPGGGCTVKVKSRTNASVWDVSDAPFTFNLRPPSVTITSPNGGETWQVGSRQTIQWNYTGLSDTRIRIELLRGSSVAQVIEENALIGSGRKDWTVPSSLAPGGDYRIRISQIGDGELDTSNANFSVTAWPTITVIAPQNGETWIHGSTRAIRWNYTGDPGQAVQIKLWSGGTASIIADNVPIGSGGTGSYTWTVPGNLGIGTHYKIDVVGSAVLPGTFSSHPVGRSGEFTIAPGSLTVTAPRGGENWAIGSTQTISWTYQGDTGDKVNIALRVAGSPYQNVASGVPVGNGGTGSYNWTVPAGLSPRSDYQIQIYPGTPGKFEPDISDGRFTISASATQTSPPASSGTPPQGSGQTSTQGLTLTSPNGGETWTAGSPRTISWTYTGNPGAKVKIQLYKGTTLKTTIASSTPIGTNGQGSYQWTIPASLAAGNDYKIKITSTANSACTDMSDACFTVGVETLQVTSPNGGETWTAGSQRTIHWTYSGNPGTKVKIQLYKGTTLKTTIASSVPIGTNGQGSYQWTIPASLAAGNDYKIKITSTANSACTDMSDAYFAVVKP
ncbi:MAG: Ser-Thr-rich GPI-anchored membrane family protein [Bacillota bacterium]|nr:Ser-Thr-rich GPI-anchored membrane family protein [Bacillota bacterium]